MSPLLAQAAQLSDFKAGEVMTSSLGLLKQHFHIFAIAFVVTLIATPLVRRLAIRIDAVDKPDARRKAHSKPVAYMGGVAVFLGLIIAIAVSLLTLQDAPVTYLGVPMAIIIGLLAITFTGLADDLWGWDPRLKVAGQLVAAAALAIENVGVKVASGVILPSVRFLIDEGLTPADLVFAMPTPWGTIPFDLIYWVGTAIIALFVLGGCNAANLIDGLDGLLSGVTMIVAGGLLVISILMAIVIVPDINTPEMGALSGARIVLCMAVLGAVLGFLPYNFNPATIFLGDCGSLLLGYCSIVVILMLGDEGYTFLVVSGLMIFSIPIIDTLFAIIRRKLTGSSMSVADAQHIHHRLLRKFGTVKKTVLALYAMGLGFALLGSTLAAIVLLTDVRGRFIYFSGIVFYMIVIALAFILARRQAQAMAKAEVKNDSPSVPASS